MSLSDNPKISVIMSVYNSENTVAEAINSIIEQTYQNWEFVICNDGSTDGTQEILESFKEKYPEKFILLKNETNKFLSYSLNRCLENSSGELIARMDADDRSAPERFEEQVSFLLQNEQYQVVGSTMRRFNKNGEFDIVSIEEYPTKNILRNRVPFCHATIMMRKSSYDAIEGYRVSSMTKRSQDLDMWFRFFANGFKGYNIQKPLYYVREDINSIKRRTLENRFNIMRILYNGYKLIGAPVSWYIYPLATFMKAFVPSKLMLMYRNRQGRK